MATSLPLMRSVLAILLERVDERLHANGIRTVILLQVVDVKFDCVPLANVSNGEEVPLAVVECVMVKVEEKVVLALSNAFDLAQVARLELSIEEDGLVVDVANVKWLGWVNELLWLEVWSDPLTFD